MSNHYLLKIIWCYTFSSFFLRQSYTLKGSSRWFWKNISPGSFVYNWSLRTVRLDMNPRESGRRSFNVRSDVIILILFFVFPYLIFWLQEFYCWDTSYICLRQVGVKWFNTVGFSLVSVQRNFQLKMSSPYGK